MNLPNKLTVFRMILIPVFMLVLALPLDWGTLQVAGAVLPVTHLVAAIIFIDGPCGRKDCAQVQVGDELWKVC